MGVCDSERFWCFLSLEASQVYRVWMKMQYVCHEDTRVVSVTCKVSFSNMPWTCDMDMTVATDVIWKLAFVCAVNNIITHFLMIT